MIAPDNKASFLLRNRSALFRNISKAHHTSPHKSVPLRELWFLSIITYSYMSFPCIVAFPSPCGDYGSYRNQKIYFKERLGRVSVPLRGLWFLSAIGRIFAWLLFALVSVPLRGLWFLSSNDYKVVYLPTLVSVPLRGLWFLSEGIFDREWRKYVFPSPCGDYGSYHDDNE